MDALQIGKLVNNLSSWTGKQHRSDQIQTELHHVSKPEIKYVDKVWKVGDYYNVDGKEGVVFWADETGRHGKIVSLDETICQWGTKEEFKKGIYGIAADHSNGMNNLQSIMKLLGWRNNYPAFAWCEHHGSGWYLPAIKELKVQLRNDRVLDKVNATLSRMKSKRVREIGWYWSSTKRMYWCAWYIGMSTGNADYVSRDQVTYVLAVSAF